MAGLELHGVRETVNMINTREVKNSSALIYQQFNI